ncbi:MAG: HAD-IA family hydrolase [Betaproteobacteria bacterium]|nr:HAD-IA family hydrolase [Betaproteobacteria bacterium]
MARRYELIVFDWDGTLLDSAATIVACIQLACTDLGVEPPTAERARFVIGLGLQDALGVAVPQLEAAQYGRLAERYRHHFLSRDQELELFPGAFDLVSWLHAKGLLLGVATGKSRLGLDRSLAASGLRKFFHCTRCADETHPKPHPAMLREIMERFDVHPGQTLMIGDTTHDLQMARAAGTDAVAVGFGAHPREALLAEGPLAYVESVGDLGQWLRESI